jgi:DNA-binding XRE family transcriptional regulator
VRRVIVPRPWLTELRKQKGFPTITDLAIALDVHDNTVRYLEDGTRLPSPALASKIGEVLGLSEADVFLRFYSQKSA